MLGSRCAANIIVRSCHYTTRTHSHTPSLPHHPPPSRPRICRRLSNCSTRTRTTGSITTSSRRCYGKSWIQRMKRINSGPVPTHTALVCYLTHPYSTMDLTNYVLSVTHHAMGWWMSQGTMYPVASGSAPTAASITRTGAVVGGS